MKLTLFNDYRLGVVRDGNVHDVTAAIDGYEAAWPWPFMPRLIARFDELRPRLEAEASASPAIPLDQVDLLPPMPSPTKILAAVANYDDHAEEMRQRNAQQPNGIQGEVFLKAPSSLLPPGGTVVLPNLLAERQVDFEVELAAIIGREMRNVPVEEALDYVMGYTVLLDMTVRGAGDRSRRKSYDSFTPMGPWIVTADEIADPQQLSLKLWRNGDLKQDGHTGFMVYTTAELLSYASAVMTLVPGDILTTGTPAGVGPVGPGDEIVAEVENVGRITVRVQAGREDWPIAEPGLIRAK